MYNSGGVLTDKEYRNLYGMYGFDFIADYINKCQNEKEVGRRINSLKRNFEKLKECNRYLSFQKMLLVENGDVKSHYKKSCSRIHNELVGLFDKLDKEKIIKIIGDEKFVDIFLHAIIIDMRSFKGDSLPEYFGMLNDESSKKIIYEFIYSNFIGNKKIKSTLYGLYKRLFENKYKPELNSERIGGGMLPLGNDDFGKILKNLDEGNFKNFIDEIIPTIKYYELIDDKDKLIEKLIIKMLKNFIHVQGVDKEKYNLLTSPLFMIETNDKNIDIIYQNLYEELMESKYYKRV